MRYWFLIMALFFSAQAPVQAACTPSSSTPVCVSSDYINYPSGATITLTAATYSNVSEVTFYDNGNVLASVSSSAPTNTFTYDWTNAPNGTYSITADLGAGAGSSSTTFNGVIDKVGDPAFYTPPAPYASNPALDGTFSYYGQAGSLGSGPGDYWVAGDNQMCSTTWPYNESTSSYPDGECEWFDNTCSGSGCAFPPPAPPNPPSAQSTVSSLNSVLHTFSDFDKFAQAFLSKTLDVTNSTFDSEYDQIADWIAPQCTGGCPAGDTVCSGPNGTGDCTCNKDSCKLNSPGRLLSIYNPYVSPPVDKLKDWNTVITNWLNSNSYAPAGSVSHKYSSSLQNWFSENAVWCLPAESDLTGTTEEYYINQNAPTGNWGDLPHVLACLQYNAGPGAITTATGVANNYSACLSSLTVNKSCVTNLPDQCQPDVLGTSVISPPAFDSDPNRCNVCPDGSACGSGGADKCNDGTPCTQSYADWAAGQYKYGPIYNYQTCLNVVTGGCADGSVCGSGGSNKCASGVACGSSTCSRSLPLPSECSSSVLGRSLLACYKGSPSNSNGNCVCPSESNAACGTPPAYTTAPASCDPNSSGSFAQWTQDNITLFTDEAPKFALRYAYLNDAYTRAVALERITAQADNALHNFFKPCSGNACADGGPASQIMYERANGTSSTNSPGALPNWVVYGWRDKPSTTGQPACTTTDSNGNSVPVGCAHLVKVQAYAPGRSQGYGAFQDRLPWIRSYTSDWGFTQNFELTQRDGYVYVEVQRWDQPHGSSIKFPNGRSLWQFMFSNPNAVGNNPNTNQNSDLFSACATTAYAPYGVATPIGFGLTPQTAQGLAWENGNFLSTDRTALGQAFMLNDNGDGQLDSVANGNEANCTAAVSALLPLGVESRACARYVASRSCPSSSGTGDSDYCIQFVDCNSIGSSPSSGPGGS
ncbi:MAG: hypothetical protein KGI24_07275 [Candidatus Omnitrophica bacterium]|nr:hypothetical protein [Candidatus Omnitrophota bacterium]MDE2215453.1 hypothetical protein [Candidatus Omnitrophota bacterium]